MSISSRQDGPELARPAGPATLNLDERISAMEAALGELTPRPPAV